MVNKVLNFVKKNKILKYGDSVILGVSGGADSICMLYVMKELEKTLELTLNVVHVNHHIRGVDAQRDADYVRNVCGRLGVRFLQIDEDIPQKVRESGMSEEEAGRIARYDAFYKMAREWKADKIAVAHNLNDNSETILFNLFRGTGIKGLTGIPFRRDMIVRPLLCCTRKEIEEYLLQHDIKFCSDVTNATTEYSRNKIRLELLPYIKENINEKVEYNIINAAQNLAEISDFLDKEAKRAYDDFVKENVFIEQGFDLHPAIQNQIIRLMIEKQAGKLKDITRTHILSIISLKEMSVSKRINLPYNLIAVREYDGIAIKQNSLGEEKKNVREVLIRNGEILNNDKFDIQKISVEKLRESLEIKASNIQNIEELVYTKWLDYGKIQGLTLRNRQEGDYIVIDDKGNRKKLKDYFINEKIPRDKRDSVLLLADGSHVVWVIGYRISSYYKITESTSEILQVTYKENI